ncbi:MAG: DNA-binding protein [Clostridiaceae bacterium]|nr:DNA-binding protein [Clostridiaceae bacterium]
MEYKKFDNKYIIRMDKGEEIVETLKNFCREEKIKLGWVKGIGAVDQVTMGLFETSIKKYHATELTGDFEITSLLGNISTMKGETYLHVHINISDAQYKTYGGHLNAAVISATGEFLIEAIDGEIDRSFSEEIGLNLYKL